MCHRLALSATPAEIRIFVTDNSVTSSLHRPDHYLREEQVSVTTIDYFSKCGKSTASTCSRWTQKGYVVKGVSRMLAEGRVAMVLPEVGFTRGDDRHVLFNDVRWLLLPHGFRLMGI